MTRLILTSLFILFFINLYSQGEISNPRYEIKSADSLLTYITKGKYKILDQHPNGCFTFKTKAGELFFTSTNKFLDGLQIYDEKVLEEFIENDKFPIENTNLTKFEKFPEIVRKLDDKDFILKRFNELHEKISIHKDYKLEDLLMCFENGIAYNLSEDSIEKFYLIFGILIGTYMQKNLMRNGFLTKNTEIIIPILFHC